MSTEPVAPLAADLSHGPKLEYKAYARQFLDNTTHGVFYLIASCFYEHTGFTIYFEKAGTNTFALMEQSPSGIFLNEYTYYVASWPPPSGISVEIAIPAHVMILDGYGEHRLQVKRWE